MMSCLTEDEEASMTREEMIQAFIDREGDGRPAAELMVDILTGNTPEELRGYVD